MLRFLSRVAFICNLCFLLVSFSQWLPQFPDSALTSDIVVLGWIVAISVNIFINLILLSMFFLRRLRKTGVPVWLAAVNFVFFALQLTILIINRNLR
ncbi:MAG TPA: hypothetical protein VHE34_14195 [Puia sp.]|uniref:hypothetical protein n=1 Tax=Puia sp. TaxID=2045100 RepID=UPI002CE51053|nr:hypothetical protein [Puia sp.]HVU96375.1 hypothetical protein [Puia sp.]